MDPQPAFTFQDLFTCVVRDMAKAIVERDGDTLDQQFARSQVAAHMILGFLPRDVIETMLAGHCVMLHEAMTADVRVTLRGDVDPVRRGPRSNVVRLNKAFNDNLDRLERYRQRPAEGFRDLPDAQSATTPDNAGPPPEATTGEQQPEPVTHAQNRAARRHAARFGLRAAAAASRTLRKPEPATSTKSDKAPPGAARIAAVSPQATGSLSPQAGCSPSPQATAACEANPAAMAALRSGDPAGFARAMGIEQPCDAFLAAANTKGSPFDRHSSGPWPTGETAPASKA
jgi:hypothetical protein